nr:pollen-specific leucine-rich repeat extensin-like protein 1 [Penaeus vannamei]
MYHWQPRQKTTGASGRLSIMEPRHKDLFLPPGNGSTQKDPKRTPEVPKKDPKERTTERPQKTPQKDPRKTPEGPRKTPQEDPRRTPEGTQKDSGTKDAKEGKDPKERSPTKRKNPKEGPTGSRKTPERPQKDPRKTPGRTTKMDPERPPEGPQKPPKNAPRTTEIPKRPPGGPQQDPKSPHSAFAARARDAGDLYCGRKGPDINLDVGSAEIPLSNAPVSEDPPFLTGVRGAISKLKSDHLVKHQMPEQSGFTPGKSTIDHILELRVIIMGYSWRDQMSIQRLHRETGTGPRSFTAQSIKQHIGTSEILGSWKAKKIYCAMLQL